MVKNFSECAKDGGKIVIKKLKNGKTVKICYDSNGNPHYKNSNKKNNRNNNKQFGPASPDSLINLAEHFNQRSNN
jgi:putative hemolysin